MSVEADFEKEAVMVVSLFTVTVQELVPVQEPDQPEKEEPEPGEAKRVTGVPVVT